MTHRQSLDNTRVVNQLTLYTYKAKSVLYHNFIIASRKVSNGPNFHKFRMFRKKSTIKIYYCTYRVTVTALQNFRNLEHFYENVDLQQFPAILW